jgi:hypothetical protein
MVLPSAGASTVICAPMSPLAPGRLSTMNVCLVLL